MLCFAYSFSNVCSAFFEYFSQFFNTNSIFLAKSFFLVKSTINPFFPLTIISFAPSVFVQITGVPSLKDSTFTIPKASDLLADILAKHLEKTDPMGRKIDYLLQELSREINIIASKTCLTKPIFEYYRFYSIIICTEERLSI